MSASIPAELPTLAARLEASRQELLDLGLRNPLLSFRLSRAQGVAVVQEEAAAVYEVLVRQGKTMYFQGVPEAGPKVGPPLRTAQDTGPAADQKPAGTDLATAESAAPAAGTTLARPGLADGPSEVSRGLI